MPRGARVVIPDLPHHVVQRGNRNQQTFFQSSDYAAYLRIAAEEFSKAGVEVWAYCLMPNHVHLIVTPRDEASLADAVSMTHVRYTRRINQRESWRGYLWQGRFSSFPMDDLHCRRCIRYVGLNPVRAGLARHAADWPWSSVRSHLRRQPDPLLTSGRLIEALGEDLPTFFDVDADEEELRKLRSSSRSGRPLGAEEWVKSLEAATGRALSAPKMGRPLKRPL